MHKRIVRGRITQVRNQIGFTLAQPIGLFSTGLMLTGATIVLSASIAQASSALQWQYDPESAALSLNLPPGTTPRYFLAAQPARIVVDVPNTNVGNVLTEKQFPGAVQQIRIAQFQPGTTRIVMQLAPGTVLAPQQVNLLQSGNQWVLRPVLADANPPAAIAAARSTPSPANPPEQVAVNSPGAAPPTATPELPPLEPGATEIPVELPPAEMAAAETPTVTVPNLVPNPSATGSPSAETSVTENSVAENPVIDGSEAIAPSSIPTENAAAAVPNSQTSAVQASAAQPPAISAQSNRAIETLGNEQTPQTWERPEAVTAALPAELPPATVEPAPLPTELPPASIDNPVNSSANRMVNVPALEPPRPSSSPSSRSEIATIEFGQPLPDRSSGSTTPNIPQEASAEIAAVNSTPEVLLPAGTVLSLRYQGEETLELANDYPLQEVLVVDRDIADQTGQVIVPAGSQVIGRFETGSTGSEFIAQAISIDGQNFLINGRSDKLSGGRDVSGNRMARNSAIGAVAGTLLGALTGVGIIAGIAMGAASTAATTYLTAPQPATIEPNRIMEVRVLEDVRQPNFAIGG